MVEQFLHHIDRFTLFERNDRILLAVSGGVDSMVMFHLFKQAGIPVGVAHCNFQLRGEESLGDEAFVKTACDKAGTPLFIKRFDTKTYAGEKGLSIQMAARQLRYNFFQELLDTQGYRYVATAHHLNDSLETTLLNLSRGTGMEGVGGIAVRNSTRIRPLLFASRKQIEVYAKENQLLWREDSSNALDAYHRNMLRHHVIPELTKINPGLEENYVDTAERLRGALSLVRLALEEIKKKVWRMDSGKIRIDASQLKQYEWPEVIVWELIKSMGFNYDQCKEMVIPTHQSGTIFYSNTHQLTIDRNVWIVTEKTNTGNFAITIQGDERKVNHAGKSLEINTADTRDFVLDKSPVCAQLDRDKVRFPLTWRNWRPGDHFVPLGMKHTKKVSDFLIDEKISVPDKAAVTVLESAGEVVWVAGYRISDRYKVAPDTKRVIVFKLC